ncbi:MAG TPA: PfkB family carbohydrate kinase [Thermoplasmata archaeon]|nr:PfkB family carbohydrate kinase [Thermoplasmata archaeon]
MARRRSLTAMPGRSRPRTPDLDLVVVGHTNLDHMFHVRQLPATDRTVPLTHREVRLGGTAANIARAAARLGVRTALVSRVGPDFPERFQSLLTQEGVDLSAFESVPEAHSPACFIVEAAGGEQVTLIDQGPMEEDSGAPAPRSLLARAGWVHLATGNPQYQLRILEETRRLGGRVAADPAQEIFYRWNPRDLRRLLEGSEIFFGNRNELARAVGLLRLKTPTDLLGAVPVVVETRGAEGAVAWTRAGAVSVTALRPRKVRQVTGAGDAFRGGFYAAWFRGDRLRECLRYGAWAAARWLETGDPSRLRARAPPGRRPLDLTGV